MTSSEPRLYKPLNDQLEQLSKAIHMSCSRTTKAADKEFKAVRKYVEKLCAAQQKLCRTNTLYTWSSKRKSNRKHLVLSGCLSDTEVQKIESEMVLWLLVNWFWRKISVYCAEVTDPARSDGKNQLYNSECAALLILTDPEWSEEEINRWMVDIPTWILVDPLRSRRIINVDCVGLDVDKWSRKNCPGSGSVCCSVTTCAVKVGRSSLLF